MAVMVGCFACKQDIVSFRTDSLTDGAGRSWHIRCARERLALLQPARRSASCPGCGGPIGRNERFTDAAERRWHLLNKLCVREALGALRA